MNSSANLSDQPNLLKKNQFYTLSACAYDAIDDIDGGDEYFARFLKWAGEAYKEFHFDVMRSVKSAEFTMKAFKQLDFPEDAVDITKIGFRTGDLIRTMTIDGNIPRVWDKTETEVLENKPVYPNIYNTELLNQIIPYWGTLDGGMLGPKFYGHAIRCNGVGYYDLDHDRRVINLKETIPNQTKVYLEWISDGINYDEYTIIHPYAYNACKRYIHWQRKENNDAIGEGAKERAKKIWEDEFDKVIMRKCDLSIDDIRECLMVSARQVPRK